MSVANVALGDCIIDVGEAQRMAAREEQGDYCVKTLAAVAGLCNDAIFEENKESSPLEFRKVNGDATGECTGVQGEKFAHVLNSHAFTSQTLDYFDSRRVSRLLMTYVVPGARLQKSRSTAR